jgi:hypothetical protein
VPASSPAQNLDQFRVATPEHSVLDRPEQFFYFRVFQIDALFRLRALMAQEHLPASKFIPLALWLRDEIRALIPQFPDFHHLYRHKVFSDILYKVLKRRICSHLAVTQNYGIAVDSYATRNLKSLIGITLRYTLADKNLMQEIFLGCREIDARGDAAPVSVEIIREILESFDLKFHNMTGATFDGAPLNLAAYAGIGSLINVLLPHCEVLHCNAHAFVCVVYVWTWW